VEIQAGGAAKRHRHAEEFEQMFGGGFGTRRDGRSPDFFEMLSEAWPAPRSGEWVATRSVRAQAGETPTGGRNFPGGCFSRHKREPAGEGGRRIEAKIPAGVKTGSRIRLGGQGQADSGGDQQVICI